MYDVIIIGGGVAGLGGAMYAGRLNLKTLVIGDEIGGTIALTDKVENYPGFISIEGEELSDKIREHAEDYDRVEIEEDRVVEIKKDKNIFKIKTEEETIYKARTLILATGRKNRKLPAKSADTFDNRGVYYCALCDGPLFKNKTVAVIGGSDSAAKEALLLAEYVKKVYIIYRGEEIHPEPVNKMKIEKNNKIKIINNTGVPEILGEDKVEKLLLDREYKGSKKLPVDGVFVSIGSTPNSKLAIDLGIKTNNKDEIIIDRNSKTSLEGVFAAGDVVDTDFKQAITGVAEGVTAAYNAYRYVTENFVEPT